MDGEPAYKMDGLPDIGSYVFSPESVSFAEWQTRKSFKDGKAVHPSAA